MNEYSLKRTSSIFLCNNNKKEKNNEENIFLRLWGLKDSALDNNKVKNLRKSEQNSLTFNATHIILCGLVVNGKFEVRLENDGGIVFEIKGYYKSVKPKNSILYGLNFF